MIDYTEELLIDLVADRMNKYATINNMISPNNVKNFNIIRDALNNDAIVSYMGMGIIKKERFLEKLTTVNVDTFKHYKEFYNVVSWVYGNKEENVSPIITTEEDLKAFERLFWNGGKYFKQFLITGDLRQSYEDFLESLRMIDDCRKLENRSWKNLLDKWFRNWEW